MRLRARWCGALPEAGAVVEPHVARWRGRRLQGRDVRRLAILLAAIAVVAALAVFVDLYRESSPTPPAAAQGGSSLPDSQLNGLTGDTGGPAITSSPGGASLSGLSSRPGTALGWRFPARPSHRVQLTVTGDPAIARLGFLVPTADSHQSGDLHNVARAWSQSLTAHGASGPYAAIFLQTDASGTLLRCTITVDGVVKDTRTISGPFARVVCLG